MSIENKAINKFNYFNYENRSRNFAWEKII